MSGSCCLVRNGTGNACCVSMFAGGEAHKQMVKTDDEISCSLDASKISQLTAWYQSEPTPSTHIFPEGASSAIVELTPSLTSAIRVEKAGTDGTQKLTFVNQCSVDVSFRLFIGKDDHKNRLVFAGESDTFDFEAEDGHVTSFGAHFQFPPKNGVYDYRYIPIHEANIEGTEVNITFKPTVGIKMLESVSSPDKASNCVVRNGTGNASCVSMFAGGEAHKQMVKADDEISCSLDASKISHLTAWYQSEPTPSTHIFPEGASSAIVELTPSLTSAIRVEKAGTDGTQKLTFVNQCSVDVSFRLFIGKDDHKNRLVFAGESDTFDFEAEDGHVTSFGAHFQFPPKNGVYDYRYIPIHEANIEGTEVNITFKPTVGIKMLESSQRQTQVQELFQKYDPRFSKCFLFVFLFKDSYINIIYNVTIIYIHNVYYLYDIYILYII